MASITDRVDALENGLGELGEKVEQLDSATASYVETLDDRLTAIVRRLQDRIQVLEDELRGVERDYGHTIFELRSEIRDLEGRISDVERR